MALLSKEELKAMIGTKVGPFRNEATTENIAAFSEVLGSTRSAVSPTFLTRCRKGEFELFTKLGVELRQVLHAEQEYTYLNDLQAGDDLVYETKLSQANMKTGSSGIMQFLTLESQVDAERRGEKIPVAISKTTVVVR